MAYKIKLAFLMLVSFTLFTCKESQNTCKETQKPQPYTTQMNDERVIIIDNDNHTVNFFTKNGLLINRVNLTTMQSQKTDLTLNFKNQIHDWSDSIFVRAELIGDKLYWSARTNRTNTRYANYLSLVSYGGMEIYLCHSVCNWSPVYDSDFLHKTTHYYTSGITNNITLEEFSNIKDLSFRAQSRK
jgi:hypothetical protein